jgi:Fic family protein
MAKLVEWINRAWLEPARQPGVSSAQRFYWSFFAATLGHLYLAWIHPFGDGNGRTARLLECAILARSGGVPDVAASLLSNHYNLTRQRYYARLAEASRQPSGVTDFIAYAAEGFADLVRQQIDEVQQTQRQLAWESYVHEMFQDDPAGQAKERRRAVALALPEDEWLFYRDIKMLNPAIARWYAGVGQKTLTRDMNHLVRQGLAEQKLARYRSGIRAIDAFRPRM